MTKVMKITPREVREITDCRKDEDYVKYDFDGYGLETPVIWLRREYRLSIFVLSGGDERDGYNDLATKVFNRLYGKLDHTVNVYSEPQQKIYGPVYICNEDEEDGSEVGFDITDWFYLLKILEM